MLLALRSLHRTVAVPLAIGLFVWSCDRAPVPIQGPTGPQFDDQSLGSAGCPPQYHCRGLAPKELQKLEAAALQIDNDCPALSAHVWNFITTRKILVYTDFADSSSGWVWHQDPDNYDSDTLGVFFMTFLDDWDLYYTLRHEADHHYHGYSYFGGENHAVASEAVCYNYP
jgi:hypothetical protein